MILTRIKTVLVGVVILSHASASEYCLDFGSALTGTDSTLILTVVLSEEEPVRGFQFEILDDTDDALVLRSVEPGGKIASWRVPAVETSAGDVRLLGFSLSGEQTSSGEPGVLLELTFDIVGPLKREVAFHFGGPAGVILVTSNLESLDCGYPGEDTPRIFPVDWLAVAGTEAGLPAVFAMESNYPNPFNATTVIEFRVPEASRVDLTVYNLLGQRVAVLAAGTRKAGVHRVTWDGRNDREEAVSSGVYLIVFRAGVFVQKEKMVLLR